MTLRILLFVLKRKQFSAFYFRSNSGLILQSLFKADIRKNILLQKNFFSFEISFRKKYFDYALLIS